MPKLIRSFIKCVAIAMGAVAGLIVGFGWIVRQPNLGSEPFPAGTRAEPAALEAHVRYLASTEPPRNWQHAEGLQRAADYIADRLSKTRARCWQQPYRARTLEAKNVIADFGPPSGPLVVVGAHYDVFGPLPGADDNASGVAGLLELARLLDTRTLKTPVELVAFSTEEPPFFGGPEMGSYVHAQSLRRAGIRARAMIALEMIGYYSAEQPDAALLLHLVYPHRGDFACIVGRWSDRELVRIAKRCFRGASDLPVVSYSGPVAIGADLSDHRNYWGAGIPAIMVTDTAYLRNNAYHTAGDVSSRLDYVRMANVVDGVLATVIHLANK